MRNNTADLRFGAGGAGERPVAEWSAGDVARWVEGMVRLPQYASSFVQLDVDGDLLMLLDDSELQARSQFVLYQLRCIAFRSIARCTQRLNCSMRGCIERLAAKRRPCAESPRANSGYRSHSAIFPRGS